MRLRLIRAGYGLAWLALGLLAPLHRGRGRGVKAVLSHDGRVLLVRHTYGPKRWELPGGGVRRSETLLDGVRREIREELSIELGTPALIAYGCGSGRHVKRIISVFGAELASDAVSVDVKEIDRAQWYRPDALPPGLGWQVAAAVGVWTSHEIEAAPIELPI
jgi:ADP-ribose pyrophosphatase YjhB (NUDIX family)